MDSSRYTYRNLVAEQPGLAILFSGLALAFFFGLTLRSFISPTRISPQVERAVSRLHPDIKVSFSSAEISLRHSIFPRVAVIVRDVVMRSENPCWGAPSLEANEIRLPLSISAILRGQNPVRKLVVDQAQVWVRSTEGCPKPVAEARSSADADVLEKASGAMASVKLSPEQAPQEISKVEINRLRISVSGYSQYTTELAGLALSSRNGSIELKAKTLLKDAELGAEFSTFANLYVLYQRHPGAQVRAHIFGNWREGHYSVIANYNVEDRQLSLESDLKHIPAGGIFSLLRKYDLIGKDIQARQVWISFKAKGMGSVDQMQKWPLNMRDIHMEGSVGEMNVERIQFTSLSPIRYEPIRVDVKKLDVGRLLNVVGEPVSTPILRDVGLFDGVVDIFSSEHVELKGVTNGLEFVFSNKGQRQFQAVDGISGHATFKNEKWNIEIVNMIPRNGGFKGRISLNTDKEFEKLDIKAEVQELLLSPVIQNLMTGHERIGPLSMSAQGRMQEGKLVELKGKASMPFLDIEGVSLDTLGFNFGGQQNSIVIEPKVAAMKFAPQSPLTTQVQKLLGLTDLPLDFHNVAGKFVMTSGLEWTDLQMDLDKRHLASQGGWDEKGQLKGTIKITEGKTPLKVFRISGHRDEPLVSENP